MPDAASTLVARKCGLLTKPCWRGSNRSSRSGLLALVHGGHHLAVRWPTMPPTTAPTPIAPSSDTDRYLEWCAMAGVLGTLLVGQAWALWSAEWDPACGGVGCQWLASFSVGIAAMLILGFPVGFAAVAVGAAARVICRAVRAAAAPRRAASSRRGPRGPPLGADRFPTAATPRTRRSA